MTTESDVVDLTDSFTLIDHRDLANSVIVLDDSLYESPKERRTNRKARTNRSKFPEIKDKENELLHRISKTPEQSKSSHRFGDCPICWEALGTNPLASTKCGHVFCLKCLEVYLLQVKKCPTCRCVLKGNTGYHPLYI